jgi:hypothetical protein
MTHYDSTKAALSFEPRMVGGRTLGVIMALISFYMTADIQRRCPIHL